jgi:hypothetical protein
MLDLVDPAVRPPRAPAESSGTPSPGHRDRSGYGAVIIYPAL